MDPTQKKAKDWYIKKKEREEHCRHEISTSCHNSAVMQCKMQALRCRISLICLLRMQINSRNKRLKVLLHLDMPSRMHSRFKATLWLYSWQASWRTTCAYVQISSIHFCQGSYFNFDLGYGRTEKKSSYSYRFGAFNFWGVFQLCIYTPLQTNMLCAMKTATRTGISIKSQL